MHGLSAIVGIASMLLDEGSPGLGGMSCCDARSISEELPGVGDALLPSGAGRRTMVGRATKG